MSPEGCEGMRGYGGREEGGPLRGCEDAWQGCKNPQRGLNLSLVEAVTCKDDLYTLR